jgi:glutamine phosphoribosylpyrophosphate amidotransferase
MCEIIAASAAAPLPLADLLAAAMEVERLGIAGFGWGVAWVASGGRLRGYRDPGSLSADGGGRAALAGEGYMHALLHLRRPSRLSTIQPADTQPFIDGAAGVAFAHNGRFARDDELREGLGHALRGEADSEVGFQLFLAMLNTMRPAAALPLVHGRLGGSANLCCVSLDGVLLYGGHPGNALHRFRLGDAWMASTGLHSDDSSIFDLVFPAAVERGVLGRHVVELAPAAGEGR